jgi:acetate CoA/acetoacetate CoA-transferase beta subunit
MSVNKIAKRAAQEVKDGQIINLGIGLPSLIIHHLPKHIDVMVHSENGVLGVDSQASAETLDADLIDAGGSYVTTRPGASFFDSAVSFAMIRRSKLDTSFMGAFEVDAHGNLANWKIPGKFSPGIGGAMELAQKTRNVIVLTTHVDKAGRSKIKSRCSLPLTAERCVTRIITDMAVIDVTDDGLHLIEIAKEVSLQDVLDATEAPLSVATDLVIF